MSAASKIRAYLDKNGVAVESAKVAQAVGATVQAVSQQKWLMNKTKKVPPKTKKSIKTVVENIRKLQASEKMELSIKVPESGVTLKVQNGKGMIGTLTLSSQGLQFATANSKKRPDRMLNWDVLDNLMKSGLLG